MNGSSVDGAIHVSDLKLWAHVGVLEKERRCGQWFSLDFSLQLDLDVASRSDNLEFSVDYSSAIQDLQKFSIDLNCLTIECFSEQILSRLEQLYGPIPMRVCLRKCSPPVSGFDGVVSVERFRNDFIAG